MVSGTTVCSINTQVGCEAVAFDCGARYLVVGRPGLFANMPRCDAEIPRGADLEAVLRREIDSPRDEQGLTLLYNLVGPEASTASTRHRRELMIRHIAHSGVARACWMEKVAGGTYETPDSVRELTLGEAPGRDKFVRDMSQSERFHEVLLRSTAFIKRDLAEAWAQLTSPMGMLTVMVGSLAVIGAALLIPGAAAVLIGVGFFIIGWATVAAFAHLWRACKLTIQAKSHEDLDLAAQEFAEAVALIGLDVLVALLTRGAAQLAPLLRRTVGGARNVIDEVTGLLKRDQAQTEPVVRVTTPRRSSARESGQPTNQPSPAEPQQVSGPSTVKPPSGAEGASSPPPSRPIWSSTKSKSARENALGHYEKHKAEFPELKGSDEYIEATQKFVDNPPEGSLTKTRANGDTLVYDSKTNTFGIKDKNGAPRTMFRPKDGLDYWNRQ